MNTIELATALEQLLHNEQQGCDQVGASLYGVVLTEDGLSFGLRNRHLDVYELLESAETVDVAKASSFVAVVSNGWASPLGDSIAPSQHPERRRVRLLVLANRFERASVVRFFDSEIDEVISGDQPSGSLNDAIDEMLARAGASSN